MKYFSKTGLPLKISAQWTDNDYWERRDQNSDDMDCVNVAGWLIRINGKKYPEMAQLYWSGYSGVIGLPSVVGPIGLVRGLPVGYQAIASHGRDFTALAFAEAVERELGGFIPPPLCI